MVIRQQKLSKNEDLFLFGARGTGKTSLIRQTFGSLNALWIDLLTDADEERFGENPDELSAHLSRKKYDYVIIDEVQKFPKLLDIVHHEIETKNPRRPFFVLTGSSARKLKRDGANMLGGRAFTYLLFPFSHLELGKEFDLDSVLTFGSLPLLRRFSDLGKKEELLRGYVKNYLREEILVEQLLRKIEPFKDFLEVAAQMNGEIINYSNISRDVGISDQTVKSFFQILEDTLLGFTLPPFHRSIRKRQRESPKFYFFDLGIKRALARQLKIPLTVGTSEYGKTFEQFVVLEVFRACEYLKNDYRLSYLRTKDGAEVDLVIERPGLPDFLLEIKSTAKVDDRDTKTVCAFLKDWDRKAYANVWSLDTLPKRINGADCFHWKEGFRRLFDN
jgi:predicted AAA+ superfamily ATPase